MDKDGDSSESSYEDEYMVLDISHPSALKSNIVIDGLMVENIGENNPSVHINGRVYSATVLKSPEQSFLYTVDQTTQTPVPIGEVKHHWVIDNKSTSDAETKH